MSQFEQDIEQVEMGIDEAKRIIAEGKDAMTLADNPLFKKIVLDGYFKNEAARLALLISDPTISEAIRGYIERDLYGIGGFKRFLSAKVQMGLVAEQEVKDLGETLDEMRAEEVGE